MLYKRVLVTGGAGFIGSHVVDELIKAGYQVRIFDNLAPPSHNGEAPEWLNKKAEFLKGDVRKKEDWQRALIDVEAVIHLAAYMDYHLDFSNFVRTNIESIALMFEVILENKFSIKKIIAASSQSVYGEGKYKCDVHGVQYLNPRGEEQLSRREWEQKCPLCSKVMDPVSEFEDDLLCPSIPYGVSKLAAEHLLRTLGLLYNIPVVSLRYSIVLGPRQSFHHFYSGALRAFVVNVLNQEPIQMNEDGLQLRDFIDIYDVARAHLAVLSESKADFQVFNVGSGMAIRVIDLAKMVADEASVEFNPMLNNRYRIGGARHSVMDITELKNLGWTPRNTVRDAVHGYLLWVRKFGNLSEILKKTETDMNKKGFLREV